MTALDLEAMPTDEIAAVVAAGAAILAKRAGGVSAAAPPRQLNLLPQPEPINPADFDRDERLSDGSRRWLTPKEAAPIVRIDQGTIIRKIKAGGFGIQIGGRYYIDASILRGRG